jgi:WD40 repeat protein
MNRSRCLLALVVLTALLVLAACSSSPRPGAGPAGRSSQADPVAGRATSSATAPPSTHPGRIRLRGRVVFASDRHRNVDIQTLDLPGGRLHRLTTTPAVDLSPAWAPDGRRLAFRSDRDGNDEIYAMNADGTGLHRITDTLGISTAGGWSPDGTQIVVASSREQDSGGVSSCGEIFTIDADGSQLVKLTDGPARDCQSSWSPDGRHILFSSDRAHPGGDSDLYVMNRDGSAITRLTHSDAEEQETDPHALQGSMCMNGGSRLDQAAPASRAQGRSAAAESWPCAPRAIGATTRPSSTPAGPSCFDAPRYRGPVGHRRRA